MGHHEYFNIRMHKFDEKLSINTSIVRRFMCMILLAMNSWSTTVASNLDTYYPLIFEDLTDGDSYFGYNVLLYAEHGQGTSWIQIGAPRANISYGEDIDLFEPGAVYRCSLSPTQMCELITASVTPYKPKIGEEKRDGSWMGAAMDVQPGPYGQLVVCSPRWTHKFSSHFMTGACYWGSTEGKEKFNFKTLVPLLDVDRYNIDVKGIDIPYFSYGEAGFSVHFPLEKNIEASSKIVIGIPGLFNWKGGFIFYEVFPAANNRKSYSKLHLPKYGISNFTDGDYTGYQVSSGYFYNQTRLLYVVGAPRAESARGKVSIVYIKEKGDEFNVNTRVQVMGTQCGEYFGSSIAVGDLNGDSYDDLIVGAPFYTDDDVLLPDYDRGRIFVYLSLPLKERKARLKETGQIIGYKPGGRFGSTIAFLGDINSDGKPEVAVGAPYEDNNRGAVYIYSSDDEGRLGNPVQRIAAKESSYNVMKGFGISISPHNVDIDRNGCPDVAIGAYLSGHAVIYRGRPIITLLTNNPVPNPKTISHNATEFSLLSACVTYVGNNAPNTLRIQRRLELDYRCKNSSIIDEITLKRGEYFCHNFTISLKPNIKDLHKQIEVIISYELPKKKEETKSYVLIKKSGINGKDSFCATCPISAKSPSEKLTIPFAVSCGGDALCTADLNVTGELPELKNGIQPEILSFVTGSLKTLLFEVRVCNNDAVDTAYFTNAYIEIGVPGFLSRFPSECQEIQSLPFLNYTLTKENDNSTELFHDLRSQSSYVQCEIGNILPGEEKKISLEIDMTYVQGHNEMRLAAWATTVNNETNQSDNLWHGKVQLNNEADVAVFGNGVPEVASIVLESENETETKISFTHYYEVQKSGHSQVDEVSIELLIPMYITEKKSKEQIQFLTLRGYKGYQGRQTVPCSLGDDDDIKSHSISKRSAMEDTFNISRFDVPSNRTLYINCSLPAIADTHLIECRTVNCIVGPLTSSQTIAKLLLKMEIDVQKLKPLMGIRHIISLNTLGLIKVVNPANLQQPPNHRPDHAMARSIFIADVPKKKVETWIYAVAIGAGIMIVLFLQMALVKAGFFKRKKKVELKALKRQTLLMISEDFLMQQRLREKSEDQEKEETEETEDPAN